MRPPQVDFYISNRRHHPAMVAPVVAELAERGVPSRVLSMCGFRGAESPRECFEAESTEFIELGLLKLRRAVGPGVQGPGNPKRKGRLKTLAWYLLLAPRLGACLRRNLPSLAVLPNDVAYPYENITSLLKRRRVPFFLMQEGIRFPLPIEEDHPVKYGQGGAAVILAWGEASAEHFARLGVSRDRIRVTGNPRLGRPQKSPRESQGRRLSLITNQVEAQGFCTTSEKMRSVGTFLSLLRPKILEGQLDLSLRIHGGEPRLEYIDAIRDSGLEDRVELSTSGSLDELLGRIDAAVVMASTVGLEVLARGIPLGVLELPDGRFAFDYVEEGAAIGLRLDASLAADVDRLLKPSISPVLGAPVKKFLNRHIAPDGDPAQRIAAAIQGFASEGSVEAPAPGTRVRQVSMDPCASSGRGRRP